MRAPLVRVGSTRYSAILSHEIQILLNNSLRSRRDKIADRVSRGQLLPHISFGMKSTREIHAACFFVSGHYLARIECCLFLRRQCLTIALAVSGYEKITSRETERRRNEIYSRGVQSPLRPVG